MQRPSPPARPPRDLRLDIVRGWMQLSIFISHVAGSVFAWGIHATWGLSDSSEQFVMLSGLTLGSVFTLKAARGGFAAGRADMLRRTLRLYTTHLTVFAMFAALVIAASMRLLPGEVSRLGWDWLVQMPALAVPGAATLLYQPDQMGILPVFVWCMLALPGFLWLADRIGAWALLPSALLHGAVQLGWVRTPGLGGTGVQFDPLAWQLLYLIGAYVGRHALLTGEGLPRRRWLVAAAALVALVGLWARLVEHGFIPGPELAVSAFMHKETLAPARLAHALALAYLVAALVPREAPWMARPVGGALAAIGRHSLQVFCVGLFLAWGVTAAMRLRPAAAGWLDLLLVPAGALALAAFAQLRERWRARGAPVRAAG